MGGSDDSTVDDPRLAGRGVEDSSAYVPASQYLEPDRVIEELGKHGARRLRTLTAPKVLVLGILAGAFITIGALFSALLAAGTENPGLERLIEGFAFSSGFFFVILSGAALFTEANAHGSVRGIMCRR